MFFSSCKKSDNYSGPDAGIIGSVIDSITKKPIQTEQSAAGGITLRFWEQDPKYKGLANQLDYIVKADGSFEHSKIFSGVYRAIPNIGPFITIKDTLTLTVNGTTTVNFTVTPYLAVTASATPGPAGSVTVKYKLIKGVPTAKIQEARAFASLSPNVSIPVSEKSVTRALTATPDATIEATEYTEVLSGLPSGQTFYVRVAARTASNARYNYSEKFKVVIP